MGTFVCRIVLSKTTGITVTVENADAGITQTIHADGTSITTTVKGNTATSKIFQDQEAVEITCNRFKVTAQTIECKSSSTTAHTSDDTFAIKSLKDFSVDSSMKVDVKATMDATFKGQNLTAEAIMNSIVKGTNVTCEASVAGKMKGVTLELEGSGQADMKGALVKVAASGMMNVEGQLTNVKGQITNISGSLVKLG